MVTRVVNTATDPELFLPVLQTATNVFQLGFKLLETKQ